MQEYPGNKVTQPDNTKKAGFLVCDALKSPSHLYLVVTHPFLMKSYHENTVVLNQKLVGFWKLGGTFQSYLQLGQLM